jgi:hypothetical protein
MSLYERKTFGIISVILLLVLGNIYQRVMLNESYNKQDISNSKVKILTKTVLVHGEEQKRLIDTVAKFIRKPAKHDTIYVNVPIEMFRSKYEQQVFINALLKDTISSFSKKIASVSRTAFFYKNKYLQFTMPISNDTSIKIIPVYKYNAEVYAKQLYIKKWLLGSVTSYIDLSSLDSNTTINGQKDYEFTQNSPKFGLRVQAISSYNIFNKRLQFGLGGAFNIKKFTILSNYLYDVELPGETKQLKHFNWIFSTKYDIARF